MKKLQIVMLSHLSRSGGGRETWISQFVPRFLEETDAEFDICAVGPLVGEIVVKPSERVSIQSMWKSRVMVPWPILFLIGYLLFSIRNRKGSNTVIAVGGLSEALPVILANLVLRRKNKSVLWLRTIYLKEKAPRIPWYLRGTLEKLEKSVVNNFDVVIANGNDTSAYYQRYRRDIVVLENAVDHQMWCGSSKVYSGGPIHVSFIGRLSDVKGIREFAEAVKIISGSDSLWASRFRFTAVGPCRQDMEVELGLTNPDCNLEYLGPLSHERIAEYLKSVDVCVNLTYGTGGFAGGGVSNALLEQMASGKPQVVWDNPIYRNVVSGSFAFFVEERNVNALALSIANLWHFRNEFFSMSASSRAKSKEYGWARHIAGAKKSLI